MKSVKVFDLPDGVDTRDVNGYLIGRTVAAGTLIVQQLREHVWEYTLFRNGAVASDVTSSAGPHADLNQYERKVAS